VTVTTTASPISPCDDGYRIGSDPTTCVLGEGFRAHVLAGHSRRVTSVAFSPNDEFVMTASADGTVRIWRAETGEEVQRLEGHTGAVLSAAFSGSGAYIATGGEDGTARLWRFALASSPSPDEQSSESNSDESPRKLLQATQMDGHASSTTRSSVLVRSFHGHAKPVTSVAFNSGDDYLVTGSNDNTVRVWRVDDSVPNSPADSPPQDPATTDTPPPSLSSASKIVPKINLLEPQSTPGWDLSPSWREVLMGVLMGVLIGVVGQRLMSSRSTPPSVPPMPSVPPPSVPSWSAPPTQPDDEPVDLPSLGGDFEDFRRLEVEDAGVGAQMAVETVEAKGSVLLCASNPCAPAPKPEKKEEAPAADAVPAAEAAPVVETLSL
jgi:WD40 repeat protein